MNSTRDFLTWKKLPALAFLWLALATPAFAGTPVLITFDDLVATARFPVVPLGYQGFQWSNFAIIAPASDPTLNGGQNGVISPDNVAFNGGGAPADFTRSTAFDFNSGYLTAVWHENLQVEVQGFVGSVLTYDNTYTLSTFGPKLINFDYLGVDEVNFISSGGTLRPGYQGNGTQFVMDNLLVTVTPEPATAALLVFGAVLAGLRRFTSRARVS